jgi:hypothetical protein
MGMPSVRGVCQEAVQLTAPLRAWGSALRFDGATFVSIVNMRTRIPRTSSVLVVFCQVVVVSRVDSEGPLDVCTSKLCGNELSDNASPEC